MQVAPKSISTVTTDYILKQPPATSPFMLIQLLPGADVSEVDPWGLSGGSISLRGLNQTEMAFIWEGSPIADVGVYTTYPSEFADSENLDELTLSRAPRTSTLPPSTAPAACSPSTTATRSTISAVWPTTATAPTSTTASSRASTPA